MSNFRSFLISTLVVLLSVFSGVLILEIFLRLTEKNDQWLILKEGNILRNFSYEFDVSDLYKLQDSEKSTVTYYRNQFGLRDSCPANSEIDILTIGGSTTDQRYVPIEYTFQSVLEKKISERLNRKVCVSNAGVDGHSSYGILFSFENWFPLIPHLKPKYVLLYIGLNDANFERATSKKVGVDSRDASSLKGKIKSLYLTQKLLPVYHYFKNTIVNKGVIGADHSPESFDERDFSVSKLHPDSSTLTTKNTAAFTLRFGKILQHISNLGAKPICIAQPHDYVRVIDGEKRGLPNVFKGFSGLDLDYSLLGIHKAMKKMCGNAFISLYRNEEIKRHFYDAVHTTDVGSQLIGKELFNGLLEKKMLEAFE